MKSTLIICFFIFYSSGISYSQQGTKDTTFNQSGIVTTDFFGKKDHAYDMVLLSDGKILTAGFSTNNAGRDVAVTKYLANGILDNTFGAGGKVSIDFNGQNDNAYGIDLQQNDKIILGGYTTIGGDVDYALLRLNTDGSLDTTFGILGKTSISINGDDYGRNLIVLSDDKILLSGYSGDDFSIVKFNSDGTIDATFGNSGVQLIDFQQNKDFCYGMDIQMDGKILLSGYEEGLIKSFLVVRLNPNGSLDSTFDYDGKANYNVGASESEGRRIKVQSNGKILVCGNSSNGTDYAFSLVRLNPDGSMDSSFGTNGIIVTDITGNNDYAWAINLQDTGHILIGGYSNNGKNDDYTLIRYNNDGLLDTSFGINGIVIDSINQHNDRAYKIVIQPNGNILLAGYSDFNGEGDFGIIRYIGETIAVGLNEFSDKSVIKNIYPIPVSNILNVEINLSEKIYLSAFLYSLNGSLVQTFYENKLFNIGNTKESFYFSNKITDSWYILTLTDGRKSYTVKILVNH